MKNQRGYLFIILACICMAGCGTRETGSELLDQMQEAVQPTKETIAEPVLEETVEGIRLHLYGGDEDAKNIVRQTVYVDKVTEQRIVAELVKLLNMDDGIAVKSLTFGTYGGDKIAILDMNQAFADYLERLSASGEYIVVGSLVNTFLECYQCDLMLLTAEGKVLRTGRGSYEEYLEMYPYVETAYRIEEKTIEGTGLHISYPQIQNLGDKHIQDEWNTLIRGNEERAASEWEESGRYEVRYTVKTQSEDTLSILMDGAVYSEGESKPHSFKYTYNIDLNTGESIRLKDAVDVRSVAEQMFEGKGYYIEKNLAPHFMERLNTIYEDSESLARALEGYDFDLEGNLPYGYSYLQDGRIWICMEVPHELGDYIEIELEAR